MLQQRWFWPGVLLALLVALAGAWALSPSLREWASSLFGQAQARSPEITASGFLEAETIRLAPEVGGRIVEIAVAEGEEVTAGQILVRLDDRIARAQVAMAEAGLEVAQARLALARGGLRRGHPTGGGPSGPGGGPPRRGLSGLAGRARPAGQSPGPGGPHRPTGSPGPCPAGSAGTRLSP